MKAFNLIALIFHFTNLVDGGDIMDIMEDCGSTGGSITDLDLEGCDGDYDDYCEIHIGKLFREKMTFSATSAVETLECNVFLVVSGVDLPVPGNCQDIDPCSAMTLGSCPIEAGEKFAFNFEYKIAIDAPIPIVRLSLKRRPTL